MITLLTATFVWNPIDASLPLKMDLPSYRFKNLKKVFFLLPSAGLGLVTYDLLCTKMRIPQNLKKKTLNSDKGK
jgi:hypothetical protein